MRLTLREQDRLLVFQTAELARRRFFSLIAHVMFHHRPQGVGAILGWIALPIIGAVIYLYLLLNLDTSAKIVGVVWLGLGVALLTWLTRGFCQAPLQLSINEEVATLEEQ